MTAISPNETNRSWHTARREPTVRLFLSAAGADAEAVVTGTVLGLPLSLDVIASSAPIDPASLDDTAALVVQVDRDSAASIDRFMALARTIHVPLLAACYEPPLALVRSLIRAGARDVIPLPLSLLELEGALAPMRAEIDSGQHGLDTRKARLVSVVKSVGGVGATALTTQLALRFAEREAAHGRGVCLIDLDLQFGDVAFQLGLAPRLTVADLLEAGGARLDGALVRAVTAPHASGLQVIAAPREMVPLESVASDHLLQIVDVATREFGTVFIDLPSNWTNWSLSLLARSDLALLITDQTIGGVNRAKRQLDLIRAQDLDNVEVRIVVNRFDKAMARTVRLVDVAKALGRPIDYTVANDFALMRSAIDRGVPLSTIRRKSALGTDLDTLDSGIAAGLGLER